MYLRKSAIGRALLACSAVALISMTGCGQPAPEEGDEHELLLYCGITMVSPMREIADLIEEEHGVKISMTAGGSQDLYDSLSLSRQGDLYLPGSDSYRNKNLDEGLLGDFEHVGFNQAALMVPAGNPKSLTADLEHLTNPELDVVLCNPESGSIGRETKRILDGVDLWDRAEDNTVYLTTDSRNLNLAIKNGDADLILNWRATAFFPENREQTDVIDLDPEVASPKKLVLNILTFSKYPEIARSFMDRAASPEGQAIFRKYGFLDKDGQMDAIAR